MCCLFGLYDYGQTLSAKQKSRIISALAVAAEARGTDAAGIAYLSGSHLSIYKRPLPAHRLRFRIPAAADVVMGHTRMTTQGSEHRNYNNHPFYGQTGSTGFALAHNGVLRNDRSLQVQKKLPVSKIETDSYVIVQLLEQAGKLDLQTLKAISELLRGSFTYTVLDSHAQLFIVRGNNPFCLYHFPAQGIYVYASTKEILNAALRKFRKHIPFGRFEEVAVKEGEILRLSTDGIRKTQTFSLDFLFPSSAYFPMYFGSFFQGSFGADSYIRELKNVAGAFGYLPEDVDDLLADGFTPEEIEECFYEGFL